MTSGLFVMRDCAIAGFVISATTGFIGNLAEVDNAGAAKASASVSSAISRLPSLPERARLWANFCPTMPPPPIIKILISLP